MAFNCALFLSYLVEFPHCSSEAELDEPIIENQHKPLPTCPTTPTPTCFHCRVKHLTACYCCRYCRNSPCHRRGRDQARSAGLRWPAPWRTRAWTKTRRAPPSGGARLEWRAGPASSRPRPPWRPHSHSSLYQHRSIGIITTTTLRARYKLQAWAEIWCSSSTQRAGSSKVQLDQRDNKPIITMRRTVMALRPLHCTAR